MDLRVILASLCGVLLQSSVSGDSFPKYHNKPEFFDLSYDLDDNTVFYPGQRWEEFHMFHDTRGVNTTRTGHPYWFAKFSFCMSEHGGTHIDAPYHYDKHGWKVNEIPMARLADIPTTVIDVERFVFSLPHPDEFVLGVEHIVDHEAKYGRIPPGSLLFVHFGWSRFWPNKRRYLGWDNSTSSQPSMNFPGLSGTTASWLLKERQIIGIGTDTATPDIGINNLAENQVVHIILMTNAVYILENVANLDTLVREIRSRHRSQFSCNLHSFVMPIKTQGTGGPVRILAYCKH